MASTSMVTTEEEKKIKKKARRWALLLLLLLLLIFFFPFMSGKLQTEQTFEKVVEVQFDQEFMETASAERSSTRPAAAESVEEEAAEEEAAEEETKPEPPKPEPPKEKPRKRDPVPLATPTPTPPVLTTNSPSEVNMSEMLEEISDKAHVEEVSSEVTEVTEEISSQKVDKIKTKMKKKRKRKAKPKPGGSTTSTDKPGTGSGPGEGDSGSSDTGDSDTDGIGDDGDVGNDFDGDGLLTRKVIQRGNLNNIIKESGKIVINLCVNRDGKVIFAEVDSESSTITDPGLLRKAEMAAEQYRYEKDYKVAEKQCGRLSFLFKMPD